MSPFPLELGAGDLAVAVAVGNGLGMLLMLALLGYSYIGPRLAAVRDLAAAEPVGVPATARPDGDEVRVDAADLDPVAVAEQLLTDLTKPEAGELRRSPVDGEDMPAVRGPQGETSGDRQQTRRATSGASWTAQFPEAEGAVGDGESAATGTVDLQGLTGPVGDGAHLLDEAWTEQNVDQLAAVASAHPDVALAASVLAAVVALRTHDRRAAKFLEVAFYADADACADPHLNAYLDGLTLPLVEEDLGLCEELAVGRVAIGCALASAERSVGDSEAAYSVLLALPAQPLVAVLTAQAALDLSWSSRALAAVRGVDGGPGVRRAALLAMEAFALVALFELPRAHELLDETLALLADDADQSGGDVLRARVLYERAKISSITSGSDAARADLEEAVRLVPDFTAATEFLASL